MFLYLSMYTYVHMYVLRSVRVAVMSVILARPRPNLTLMYTIIQLGGDHAHSSGSLRAGTLGKAKAHLVEWLWENLGGQLSPAQPLAFPIFPIHFSSFAG